MSLKTAEAFRMRLLFVSVSNHAFRKKKFKYIYWVDAKFSSIRTTVTFVLSI